MITTTTLWADYIIAVASLLFVYYLVVVFKFYRKELFDKFRQVSSRSVLKTREKKDVKKEETMSATNLTITRNTEQEADTENEPPQPDPVLMDKTEELVFEMKDQLSKTSKADENRDAILTLVQKLFGAYTELRGTPYQLTVNEWLKNEWEESGLTRLSEEELSVVWEVS